MQFNRSTLGLHFADTISVVTIDGKHIVVRARSLFFICICILLLNHIYSLYWIAGDDEGLRPDDELGP